MELNGADTRQQHLTKAWRAAVLSVAATAVLLSACREQPPVSAGTAPDKGPAGGASVPEWFLDITARSGVAFQHLAGTNYFMPDQVGAGVAILDFDRDDRPDLYFVQNGGERSPARNQLFQQQPDGTFRNVSAGSGLDVAGPGMGAIAGDVNDDGLPDIVLTEYGATRLFQNLGGGKFHEVTREAGLDNPLWAVPASFVDFDRDGRLDVVVGNYLDYDPTQVCRDVHGERDFCAPQAFASTVTRLWHNVTPAPGAQPRFEEVTERSGLARVSGAAMGLVCADFTGDDWPDIFCADDGRPNRLFVNQRNGTFVEEAVQRGLAFNAMGRTAANMGVVFADFHSAGRGDLFITHLTEEYHSLFRPDQPGLFTDAIAQSGLQRQTWRGTGFGTIGADFDLNGAVDLAVVNGSVRRAIPGHKPVVSGVSDWWGTYAQRGQLFANDGPGSFVDVSAANPAFCGQAQVGRSLVVADLDGDGAVDLIASGVGGPARLYRNVAPRRGHWLKLRLIDSARGGRDVIGAEVVVRAKGRSFWAVLQPATSYLASNDPVLHFGLGPAATVDSIEVLWPHGGREMFGAGPADRLLTLEMGRTR